MLKELDHLLLRMLHLIQVKSNGRKAKTINTTMLPINKIKIQAMALNGKEMVDLGSIKLTINEDNELLISRKIKNFA